LVDHDLWWRDLRVAVGARDADRIVSVLTDDLPSDGLQLAGDALLVAMVLDASDATGLARRCAGALAERSWAGDAELVVALGAATGDDSSGPLVSLPVDLEELADVIDGAPGEGEGYLDRVTGDVWPAAVVAYNTDTLDDEMDFDDRDRWLVIVPEGSQAAYRDMTSFIDTLADPNMIERLERAIHGRGAFGRFRDTLSAAPAEFTRWHRFSADRQRGRARAWLAQHGYQPAAIPTRTDGA
jgi:hypothetical protein